MSDTETILQEAERIINGPRRSDYGPVEESFLDIASRWTVELGSKLTTPLTAFDVAHLMVQLKLSRAKNGFHRDSYVDICGYAGLTEKLPKDEKPTTEKGEPAKPRVWQNVYDIPLGTLVRTGSAQGDGREYLTILEDGTGWYQEKFFKINDGWALQHGKAKAPFTEVLP